MAKDQTVEVERSNTADGPFRLIRIVGEWTWRPADRGSVAAHHVSQKEKGT